MRAEIAPGAHRSFAADVAAWIRAAGFRAVIALASVPSTAARTPDVIGATLFRHVTASGAPDPRCEALKHPRVAVPYAESEVGPSTPDAALPSVVTPPRVRRRGGGRDVRRGGVFRGR